MSVDFNGFELHHAELEIKLLRNERDALAEGLRGACSALTAMRPVLVIAPDMQIMLDSIVARATALVERATRRDRV